MQDTLNRPAQTAGSPEGKQGMEVPSAIKAVATYDPYGYTAKLGLIVPSTNTVNAHEWVKMLPEGCSVHTARALLTGEASQRSYDIMAENTFKAAEELATAEVDLVAYGCTSGSFLCSRHEITRRIREIAGVPATTTSDSVVAALSAFGVRRLAMATPYVRFVNEGEVGFLQDEGFEVVAEMGLGLGATQAERRAINRVPPEAVIRMARLVDRPEADAIFISCTALPTMRVIAQIEAERGKPVITSNQATLWNSLRMLGLKLRIEGYGRLLTDL